MSITGPVRVGVIGAGMISDQYLNNLARYPDVQVVGIGARNVERAVEQSSRHGIAKAGDVSSVLEDDDVEIVINLTVPAAHVEISRAALEAGKHVWSEKPIGIERAQAHDLLELAAAKALLLGVAPDTVLGPFWQTAKRAILAGAIGEPLTATTSFQSQGPEWFHPDPAFLFARGAGPLFDIGPYYLSALVHLLGPIRQVVAVGTRAADQRMIRVGPRSGARFPVEVPTHLSIVSSFSTGASASSLMSTDTALYRHGVFEINGTEGTMVLGDPNYFGGSDIRIYRPSAAFTDGSISQTPELLRPVGPLTGRGVGVVTMARALRQDPKLHVATGTLGYHVLDTMVSIEESIESMAFVDVTSSVEPTEPLPEDFDAFARSM